MNTPFKTFLTAAVVLIAGFVLIVPRAFALTEYEKWEQRHEEREQYWAELAIKKPSVYLDAMVYNHPKSNMAYLISAFSNSKISYEQAQKSLVNTFNACMNGYCPKTAFTFNAASGTYLEAGTGNPWFQKDGYACVGWGCLVLGQTGGAGSGTGAGSGGNGAGGGNGNGNGSGNGAGNGTGLLGTPLPSDQPLIEQFEITNFIKRTDASSGAPFYFILVPQMQAGYKANIAWTVSGAQFCTAACTYTNKAGTRLPDGAGQANDCQWRGNLPSTTGSFKVQPKWQGYVHYTLTCVNGTLSATKSFDAAIKEFSWQEVMRTQLQRLALFTRGW